MIFITYLNETYKALKFNLKKENNNEIFYLDILIKWRNKKFRATDYRKETFAGNYLNFQTHCDRKRKTKLIWTLCHRAH